MKDEKKTKKALIEELQLLRSRIAELEAVEIERQKAASALNQSQEMLSKVFQSSPDNIVVTRLEDGTVLDANESFFRSLRYTPEEVLGKSSDELRNWADPEDRRRFVEMLTATGKCVGMETRFRAKDGSIIPAQISARVIEISGEDCVVSSTRDISEIKRAEVELRKAYDELEARVAERTKELTKANERLKAEIAERRRTESALRESEELYRKTVEAAPHSITITRVEDGRYLMVNDYFCKRSGYTREEALGRTPFDLGLFPNPEDRDRIVAIIKEKGEISGFALQYRTRTGEILDTLFSGSLVSYGADECMVAIVTDISALKRTEKELEARERIYRSIFQNTGTATMIEEDDRTISAVNAQFEKLTGYKREELEWKMTWDRFVAPEDRNRIKEYHDMNPEEAPTEFELTMLDKMGKRKTLFARVGAIPGSRRRIASLIDITSRKQSERALKDSEERFKSLSENAPDIIFTLGTDGAFTYLNPAFERILGYERAEGLGKYFIDFAPKANHRIYVRYFKQIRDQMETIKDAAVTLIHKDGSTRLFSLSGAPNFDASGSVPGMVGVCRDITEQRKLQTQLQHAQKMESMGVIASGVAHNFRNILAGISVNSQLLELKHSRDPSVMEIAKGLGKAVHAGAELVNGLLQFSHRPRERDFRVINLSQVIQENYTLIRQSFDKRIDIQVQVPDTLLILGNAAEISQVIMNLCINARDAMPDGGELSITALQKAEHIEVVLSDTGQGMGAETLQRCFDPFFSTKEAGGGTGLGLSTSYGIIREHGGQIHAYSELGLGTTFRITLPPAEAVKGDPVEPVSDLIKGSGQKVLVVDDEMELLKPMEEILEFMGYRAASASGGEDAVDKCASWRPHVVLMDRNMPGMDGIAVTQEIIRSHPDIRIVLVSGYDDTGPNGIDPEDRAMISGYLTKPVEMLELARLLADLLHGPQSNQGS